MTDKVKIVDNILPDNLHEMCYELIMNEGFWSLTQTSVPDAESPGVTRMIGTTVYDADTGLDMGNRAHVLSAVIYQMIKVKVPTLSNQITRILIGAKTAFNIDVPHVDHRDTDRTSVLFYLNRTWNKEWGGGIKIDGKEYEYKPNRALIFKSNLIHAGTGGNGPGFRTYINYVAKDG
jgi:hypothetical protein